MVSSCCESKETRWQIKIVWKCDYKWDRKMALKRIKASYFMSWRSSEGTHDALSNKKCSFIVVLKVSKRQEWHWSILHGGRDSAVAAALTAVASLAYMCRFHSSLIDSLAAPVSSFWSLHPLSSLCTQVEQGSRGSRTGSPPSTSTYVTQISMLPFLCPSPEGIELLCTDERGWNTALVGWQ